MSAVDLESGPGAEGEGGAAAEAGTAVGSNGLVWDPSALPVPLGHGPDAEPLALDWSGRGEPDLIVTAGPRLEARRAWLHRPRPASGEGEGEPAGAYPRRYDAGERLTALDGLRSICVLPGAEPGRFDLVGLGAEGLVWLPNQGQPGEPAFCPRESLGLPADLGLGPVRIAQMAAVDWDGDGLVDLLVGLDDLEGYWPDAGEVPPEQQVGFTQGGGHPGYDREGRWRGRPPQGRLRWLRNVGQPGRPAFELQPEIESDAGPLDLALRPAPLAVAWGGGSGLELLLSDARGEVRLHRNFGGQRPPVLLEPRPIRHEGRPLTLPEDRTVLAAADLDGDRRVDLLFGTADGRVFAVRPAPGRDNASAPAPVLADAEGIRLGGGASVTAGDLDGDGGLDLVAGDAAGRLWMVRDLGGPREHRYARPVEVEAGGEPFRIDPGPDGLLHGPAGPRLGFACPALADWSGHGRLDLVVSGASGEVLVLPNDGSAADPRFAPARPLRCQGAALILPPRVRPAAADWDGDGRLDLVGLDLQGFLCVYPRVGPYEVGAPKPLVDGLGRLIRLDGGFGQNGRCSLWAGPWTGRERPDLLVGLPLGNRHVVPALAGLPLGDPDDLPTVLLLEAAGKNVVVPRPIRREDGSPLVVGTDGCTPAGVPGAEGAGLDLLVGSDDGTVLYLRRDELQG